MECAMTVPVGRRLEIAVRSAVSASLDVMRSPIAHPTMRREQTSSTAHT